MQILLDQPDHQWHQKIKTQQSWQKMQCQTMCKSKYGERYCTLNWRPGVTESRRIVLNHGIGKKCKLVQIRQILLKNKELHLKTC